jgi:phosphatidylglycerophosphatase A
MEQNRPDVPLLTRLFGTGFFTGYAPFAPGTVASAVAAACYFIPGFPSPVVIMPLTALFFVLGVAAAGRLELAHGQDPSIVTIDEIIGMWIALWLIPPSWLTVLLAFFLFRILDILKPYPAGEFDKRKGGMNIMLDDVIAGIYTNFILQVALKIFP